MTKDEQIKILTDALKWYKKVKGTKVLCIGEKGYLYVENGIVADEALVKAKINKKPTIKKQYP